MIPKLKDAPAAEIPAGNFIAMIQAKAGGVALSELDHKLAKLVRAVRDTGKPGTFTYTVKIKRNKKHGMKLIDDCKVKIPEEDSGEAYLYSNEHGQLLANNPEGPDLPGLTVVPDEPAARPVVVTA